MAHHFAARALISSLTNSTCALSNVDLIDQTTFWDANGVHWDAHRIGWAIAGGCSILFVVVKPLLSIAAIVTEAFGVYCGTSTSFAFANIYLEIIDFVSVTIALYGLFILYSLTREDPKADLNFNIVALVFYQGFVFTYLQKFGVIEGTQYWTATNVSEGLNALVTTVEMILIALFQLYAFSVGDYSDFAIDVYYSFKYWFDLARNKPYTRSSTAYSAQVTASGGNSYALASALDPSELAGDNMYDPARPWNTPEIWAGQHDGGSGLAGVGAMKKVEPEYAYPPRLRMYEGEMYPPSTASLVKEKSPVDGSEEEINYGEESGLEQREGEIGGEGMGSGRAHALSSQDVYSPLRGEDEDSRRQDGWAR
ncbi:hypothetical protein P7C70_g1563, partial [Phenoliferia sp. Uapishka_3]